jgi:HK97 family phage prohead protease
MKRRNLPFKVKAVDEKGAFSGYASVFGVVDLQGEEVAKGAFEQTLEEAEELGRLPKLLWMHDDREPIGGFTKMAEDDRGLWVEGKLLIDAGPVEKRAYAHMKEGLIDGLSIGFNLYPGGLEFDAKRGVTILKNIKLWEVSVVSFPACEEARIESVKSALASPREFERLLRDAGLSRSQAKALMGGGFKALGQRDVDREAMRQVGESIKHLTQALRG